MNNDYQIKGDITVIFLRRRDGSVMETLIDTVDLEKAYSFTGVWNACYDPTVKSFYVRGHIKRNGKRTSVALHRWITGEPKGLQIDHINHNTLDNRRSVNLRIVDQSKNKQNVFYPKGKSGHLNVDLCNRTKKWRVRLSLNGKRKCFGYFDDLQDAINRAKEVRKKHYGLIS